MHARLLEIHHEMDSHWQAIFALQAEERAIIQSTLPDKATKVPLSFDEQRRTIRWTGGMVRLSRKQFSLMKTLWNNGTRTETLDVIESTIWHEVGTEEKPFVDKNTIFALVSRLRNSVSNVGFPYEIESYKDFETGELQGYCLVLKE